MNQESLVTLSFKVSADDIPKIEQRAAAAGMNRSEYLRHCALSSANQDSSAETNKLLRHIIYILARIHSAAYFIPERQQVLSTEALQSIYADTIKSARNYMADLDNKLPAVQ
jgi:hypothetical protein